MTELLEMRCTVGTKRKEVFASKIYRTFFKGLEESIQWYTRTERCINLLILRCDFARLLNFFPCKMSHAEGSTISNILPRKMRGLRLLV